MLASGKSTLRAYGLRTRGDGRWKPSVEVCAVASRDRAWPRPLRLPSRKRAGVLARATACWRSSRPGTDRLPQRILLKNKAADATYTVPGCRIGTSSLRKCEIFHTSSMEQPREAKVSFDTPRLSIKPILVVALPGEFLHRRPRPGPYGR